MHGWWRSCPDVCLRLVRALTVEPPKSALRTDASWTRGAKAARFSQRELASDGSVGEFFIMNVNVVILWFLQKVSKERRVDIGTSARGAILGRRV